MTSDIIDTRQAADILHKNDRGGHTVPTDGLYPFQWSWDSAITALGWLHIDEARAWQEAQTMFGGQWDNGMLPHILFHGDSATYFPGPDVWGSETDLPSSAISQPPIWATALRMLFEESEERELAERNLRALLPKLIAYHDWWYSERDPDRTGLVCSYHPWESGMDNSPAWDAPLRRVPEVDWSYQRRDLGHVDSEQRPKKPEYDRYLYLVDFYKRHRFDSAEIYRSCPYKVLDIGIVSILHRANRDLKYLCGAMGEDGAVDRLDTYLARTSAAIRALWSPNRRCFLSRDLKTGELLDEVTTATVLPLLGGLADDDQARLIIELIAEWLEASAFGLASTHPTSPRYEPKRYWRGPVWVHMNWLIALGLENYGAHELAQKLKASSIDCIRTSGFWEYFDAESGAGCGGDSFSWTAAVAINWLAR